MKEEKSTRLRFTYAHKEYTIVADSIRYAETLIINKLKIGHARYWLIFQNGEWRFIGEMPLCRELKDALVRQFASWHHLPFGHEAGLVTGKESVKTGILLNTLLAVVALKKLLPYS